jgi:hypothetical protein
MRGGGVGYGLMCANFSPMRELRTDGERRRGEIRVGSGFRGSALHALDVKS